MRRTSIKGTKHVPLTHKYSTYSYAKKLAVINHFRDGGHIDATLSQSIYRWENQRQLIEKMASHHASARQSRERAMGHGLCEAAEEQLVGWVNNLRGEGLPVSSTMLRVQALEIDVPESKFTASHVCQRRFLCAHSLAFRYRTHQGQQSLAAATEAAAEFAQEYILELLPKRTISNRGTKTVWVKSGRREKQRATAMVLANASGIKFPLFMVFHSKQSTNPDTQQINVKQRHRFGVKVWNELTELQDTLNAEMQLKKTKHPQGRRQPAVAQ
ncbi:TPA: LOW QUALITY PROTEIN: hypothetical protein N0F65_011425 [Lagenidium giganteum]|uniref:HTH CENPB-type domain-containing protein n=1 Tax=Lagenidium giganteum TaxID=4803 RepID=A0AAV2ZE38_9STRA|nr:TPA: LOW QUALITY PROTEIN: hypothetical protein N0F65_011425 [Lagenidium giganteum]